MPTDNKNEDVNIINDYIESVLKNEEYDSYLKLQNIVLFINSLNDFKESQDYLEMLESNSLLKDFVNSNIKELKHAKDERIIIFIEDYCMANNIELYTENGQEQLIEEIKKKVSSREFSDCLSLLTQRSNVLLTKEETYELLAKAHNGDINARNTLVIANQRLIVSIAKRYIGAGIPLLDLVQEGSIGIIKAINQFDLGKGFMFSTYATWWIRQAITRYISNNSNAIRVPVYMSINRHKVYQTLAKLEGSLKRQPTPQEIAEEADLPIETVITVLKIPVAAKSLNQPIGDEDDSFVGDFIEDKNAVSPEESAIKQIESEQMKYYFSKLKDERTREVLRMRFGFYDNNCMTLEEIGKHFNVTRERIRQIEEKGKKQLKKIIERESQYPSLTTYKKEIKPKLPVTQPPKENKANSVNMITEEKKVQINKEEQIMPKQIQTIYEYFNEYSKEAIDSVIEKLSLEERKILISRYGEDLNHPTTQKDFDPNMKKSFYGNLIPKIKRTLVKENNTKQKEPKKRACKYKNIYEYFPDYTKEEIDSAIETLPQKDKDAIKARFDSDKECPKDQKEHFYHGGVIPKINRKLEKNSLDNRTKNQTTRSRKSKTVYEYFKGYSKDQIDSVIESLSQEDKDILNVNFNNNGDLSDEKKRKFDNSLKIRIKRKLEKLSNNIDDQADKKQQNSRQKDIQSNNQVSIYNKLTPLNASQEISNESSFIDIFKHPLFQEQTRKLPLEQSVILALKLGYINNKTIDTETIANLFGIEVDEINLFTKTILNHFKKELTIILDQTHENKSTIDLDPLPKIDITFNKILQEIKQVENENENDSFIDVFNHEIFKEKTKMLPLDHEVIIALKLGYINNKVIETQTIADLLGMDTEEVNTKSKTILNDFKKDILNLLNNNSNYPNTMSLSSNEKPNTLKKEYNVN